MQKKLKILIGEPLDFSKTVVEKLTAYGEVELKSIKEEDLEEILNNYDIFWFRLAFQINENVLSEHNRCKILATPVTGIDHIDENLCTKLGIKIICLRGEKEFLKEVRATAEMAIGLTISLMRNIVPAAQSVQKGEWKRDLFRGYELYNKTFGIIGFGRLGEIVAQYAQAFDMKVLAYDIYLPKPAMADVVFTASIEELVGQADIVSLHVNYQDSTHHLIDESVLRKFKKGAYLINTSRGGLVDEKALLKAIDLGHLAGAALDVLQNESELTVYNPLIQYSQNHSNLLIVPHIGGNSYESFTKTEHFIADKITALLESNKI